MVVVVVGGGFGGLGCGFVQIGGGFGDLYGGFGDLYGGFLVIFGCVCVCVCVCVCFPLLVVLLWQFLVFVVVGGEFAGLSGGFAQM